MLVAEKIIAGLGSDAMVRKRFPRFVIRAQASSTNDVAWQLLAEDSPDGSVVIAGRQTGGRGRLGREWSSPPGNLYLSVLRKLVEPLESAGIMSLITGLAVAEALEDYVGMRCSLKWPNDLLVQGRKLGGILLEGRQGWQVIGLGINVNTILTDLAPEVHKTATTLRVERQQQTALEPLVALILLRLAELEGIFLKELRLPVERYLRYFPFRGQLVQVQRSGGDLIAPIAGIAEDGALQLDVDGQIVRITAGEVTHVRPA
jgi:BirA family transcriptional regulator, biotin operon repressor / biotin---[acetyl-CoA-carboxylase] ligase